MPTAGKPRFLHAAQIARYVEGRDTSRVEEVVRIAEAVAAANDTAFNAAIFAERLQSDAALLDRVKARMAAARSELHSLRMEFRNCLFEWARSCELSKEKICTAARIECSGSSQA